MKLKMNKNLNVTLKKKWFDMESHPDPKFRKDEEYREIKGYWIKRLLTDVEVKNPSIDYPALAYLLKNAPHEVSFCFEEFEYYIARNGYNKDAPVLKRKCLGIEIGYAKAEWSDNWPGLVFIIKLGDIIND